MLNKDLRSTYSTNAVIESSDKKSLNFDDFLAGAITYIERNPSSHLFADDMMQTVSEKMWVAIPRNFSTAKSSPEAYGYFAARNCHYDFWRNSQKSGRVFSDFMWYDKDGSVHISQILEMSTTALDNPETDVANRDFLDIVWKTMKKRSEIDNAVLRMTSEGFSPKEIGDELGLTANAVSMRLFKLRNWLTSRNAA